MHNNLCCQTIFEASARGHHNCLLKFLDTDLNAKDHLGWTPLHIATCAHRVPIVKTLLDRGCNYLLTDNHGRNALDHVTEIIDYSYWDEAFDYTYYADIKELLLSQSQNITILNNI